MRNFWIVLGQTYWDRVRTKIFIGMTLLLIGGGIFLFSFPTLVQKFSGEKEKAKVVFISEVPNVTVDQSNLSKALPEWDWSLGDKTKLNQYKQQQAKEQQKQTAQSSKQKLSPTDAENKVRKTLNITNNSKVYCEYESVEGEEYVIHVYQIVSDKEGGHTATYGWFNLISTSP